MKKTTYYGFRVNQNVTLMKKNISDSVLFLPGQKFKIINFPPCVTYCPHQYFVFGKTKNNNYVRCNIDDIK